MRPFSTGFCAALLTALLLPAGALVPAAQAQSRPASRQTAPALESDAANREAAIRMDAQETRRTFMEILERHPPAVGRVLKLDPSLMRNESYLSAYPQVREFIEEHPEVALNAGYYLEQVQSGYDHWNRNFREELTQAVLAGVAGFTAFIVVLSTLVWIIRTVVDHRRWNRLSRIQADVHTKLMDRFSSNEELLTYVQTPSGRRFLESGPSPLQEAGPALNAPFSRILWSVQLGSVLLVGGVGLLFLSGRAIQEAREVFYITGCLATAIGAGFLVSAAAAYMLSRRLGLLERSVPDHA
jgi:hypothetical protein